MDDAVRITAKQFRLIYQEGFRTWAKLYFDVNTNSTLSSHIFLHEEAFAQQPAFQHDLYLKRDKYRVFASGSSVWGSRSTTCDHSLPSFNLEAEIEVTRKCPTSISIVEPVQRDDQSAPSFSNKDNYLSVLILAWAYILSARWAEIMPEPCSLRYTESQNIQHERLPSNPTKSEPIQIEFGDASPDELRWWAAVLAPGQGWMARMEVDHGANLSPWSLCLDTPLRFLVRGVEDQLAASDSAAGFSTAREYLRRFCLRHNLFDQSHAALAAVLLLSSMVVSQTLQIPFPKIGKTDPLAEVHLNLYNDSMRHDWVHQGHDLDKLLTLGCYTGGTLPMLLSVFYEPSIECNAVTPWFQGTLAAIDTLAGNDSYMVARMCMERSPRIGCLWVGCTILGLQSKVLRYARCGTIPKDLHSAAWSGTVQTFIQLPVSNPLTAHGLVSRADECRLLFMSQRGFNSRLPTCQWKPFGTTALEDVDIEVRLHAKCVGHGLEYRGFVWNITGSQRKSQQPQETISWDPPNPATAQTLENCEEHPICYNALNRDKEVVSENETRSILGWLRFEGRTQSERRIWSHEWFDLDDSDDEDVDSNEAQSEEKIDRSSPIKSWLLSMDPGRH